MCTGVFREILDQSRDKKTLSILSRCYMAKVTQSGV